VEMVHEDDIEGCIQLMLASIKKLQAGQTFQYDK